jgi:hypothetical protein
MRIFSKSAIFTIFLSLLLLVTPALVSAQVKPDNAGSAKPKKTEETTPQPEGDSSQFKTDGILFPEIEGWESTDIQTYPTPALGYSVTYQSEEGGRLTVYVYDGGLKTIPNDITDKVIVKELDKARNEILQIGKMGVYENVKEIKSDTVTLGGANGKIKAVRSLFNFSVKGNKLDSEIYLFGHKNKFVKIRSTRPKAENGAENKALVALLAKLDNLFAAN